MPMLRDNLQMVGRKSSAKTIIVVCLMAGFAASLATYGVGSRVWVPLNPKPTYTATVAVVERAPAGLDATSETESEVSTPFTSTDVTEELAVIESRALADHHVGKRRAAWLAHTEELLRKARLDAGEARQTHDNAVTQLASLQQQLMDAARAASEKAARDDALRASRPKTVENPRWREVNEQLVAFRQRQERLLVDRTPEHPAVREIATQMEAIKTQLAGIPPSIPAISEEPELLPSRKAEQETTEVSLLTPQDQEKVKELSATVARTCREYNDANSAVDLAAQALANEPRSVIHPAQVVMHPAVPDQAWRRLAATTVAAGILMALGVGAVGAGRRIEPLLSSAAELKDRLPILGVVPADAAAGSRGSARRLARMRRVLMGIGAALVCACPMVAMMGIRCIY